MAFTFKCRLGVFLLFLVVCTDLAHSQGTARIAGTVTDQTGGVLPGAKITLVNIDTGQIRETITNDSGYYTFLNLPPGRYNLSATLSGFKTYVRSDIMLQVAEAITINVTLEVGEVTEEVTVVGAAPLVNTQTVTLQETVDSARIKELPLNGRDARQLVGLVAGSFSFGGSGQFGQVSPAFIVNGARNTMINYELDGGQNIVAFWNSSLEYPNPDALQEFTVKTHSFSAVHGRNAGAVVEAVTRSGTNDWHGSAFEFLRNTVFDARPFFAAKRPDFKRNQYGLTFGGPVKRDRHFFFFSWQGTKQRGSPVDISFFPLTPEEQRGDFSKDPRPIIDPLTGKQFPGNIIPSNRLNPVTQNFLKRFPMPLPNLPDGRFSYSPVNKLDQNQFVGRFDFELTSKDRLMGRIFVNDVPQVAPWTAPPSSDWFPRMPTTQYNYTLSWTRTFNPKLINEARVTYTGASVDFLVAFPWHWGEAGADVRPSHGFTPDFQATVSGKFNWATGPPTRDRMPTTHFKDIASIIRGRHSIQAGIEIYKNRVNQIQDHLSGALAQFTGQFTGNAAADWALGKIAFFLQQSALGSNLHQTLTSLFVQDDIKLTRHLTLNLGIRYEPYTMFWSEQGKLATFIPGRQSQRFPNTLPGLLYPGDPGIPKTVVEDDLNNLAPRFGIAWDPFGDAKTSIRASYGIFYDPMTRGISLNRFTLIPPFQLTVRLFGVDFPNVWDGPPWNGVNPYPHPPAGNDELLRQVKVFPGTTATSLNLDFATPYNQHWNLSIDRQLGKDWIISLRYIGLKGTKLYHSIDMNPARYIPGQSTLANTQDRRIYPWIGRIEEERTDSYSNHHAFQVSVQKRLSAGYTILTSYTLGKTLGLNVGSEHEGGNGPRNPGNWRLDYGRLPYDLRHRWVTSFIWDLPGSYNIKLAKHLLEGWSWNGILTIQSGFPFTVFAGVDRSLTAIGRDTADLVGDPRLPNNRPRSQRIAMYFNTSAFAMPAEGTFGTAGMNILEGPGFVNFDMALVKNIRIHERHSLQFRLEAFNALNRPNFGNPSSTLAVPALFGRILGTGAPRVIEFGIKYQF